MTTQTAEEGKTECIRVMGQELGSVYSALWQQLAGLHHKWDEYVTLFGTKPSRVELLNRASASFFRLVQDSHWEDILLHIARLTDPPGSGKRTNLSIQRLPKCIRDPNLRNGVDDAISSALSAAEFCRDWRNRHIAHRDLGLALEQGVQPLIPASRQKVRTALDALDTVLNAVSHHYQQATTFWNSGPDHRGAMSLLHVTTLRA
jgi:hypothetical protein